MLQKLPNYSCALYPAWLKLDRGISLRLTDRDYHRGFEPLDCVLGENKNVEATLT